MNIRFSAAVATAMVLAGAQPALAAAGEPIQLGSGITFDPIIDGRLRYEHVDQPTRDADAVTLRFRTGAEFRANRLSFLAESEATLGVKNNYNAYSFASSSNQYRPQYAGVGDPENIELNRLQLQYRSDAVGLTLGRQRITLDDQRFVGTGSWRQNEQTFDAVRLEAQAGPLSFDGSYVIDQRTSFGIDAGPRQSYDGKFWLLGAGANAGPLAVKGFAYLLDYDEAFVFTSSSQTYGVRATTALPLGGLNLNLAGSYARQSDYGRNPVSYTANYYAAEGNLSVQGLTFTGGFEQLGADDNANGGAGFAVQMPMGTKHKFNGWADQFTNTPNRGLRDFYAGASFKTDAVSVLPGLNAAVTWHRFDSTVQNLDYGREWDASVGFNISRLAILAKYADYKARSFGADTKKFWLQAEFSY